MKQKTYEQQKKELVMIFDVNTIGGRLYADEAITDIINMYSKKGLSPKDIKDLSTLTAMEMREHLNHTAKRKVGKK